MFAFQDRAISKLAPVLAGLWAGVLAVGALGAQANKPAEANPTLSTRVVAYQIEARLDVVKKTLDASETLTYRNLTGQLLQEFPFHLYLNAFQPQSTFMGEVRRDYPGFEWKDEYRGLIEVKSFQVVGQGDLTSQMKFIQPDDGNPLDRTVFQVRVPRRVAPNAEVQFKMLFHAKLPEIQARTGAKRDFFMVAQWFPKVGVWWKGAWNCHQFHDTTEFFADFGTYDVKLTVPRNYVLGASGEEVAQISNPDGMKTVAYRGGDIHDFAWTAWPDFRIVDDAWTGSAGAVKIRLLMSPEHLAQASRYLRALKGTLERFDRWYGPYPYKQITLVDPPHGAMRAGGMEYPTLFTAGTTCWMPKGLRLPELVTVHEFGHQYWYGMVATNEFEEAWLDEGINSYTEVKVMDSLYGRAGSAIDLWGVTLSDADYERCDYLGMPDTDPLTRRAYQFMTGGAYGAVSYGKTATMLLTLEGMIGEEALRGALDTYFMRYRFTHPTGDDFLRTVQEVSGRDLRWFYDQVVYGTQVLDYAVQSIRSERVDWFEENPPHAKKGETLYRSTVLVRRRGDFVFPLQVEVRFDNGEKLREQWDGRDRWIRYTYLKKAKIVSAEIDPDHKVWLDRNLFNNSRTSKPNRGGTLKLANTWLFVTQFFAQLLAWLC
jgi:hypothetical protein